MKAEVKLTGRRESFRRLMKHSTLDDLKKLYDQGIQDRFPGRDLQLIKSAIRFKELNNPKR